MPVGRLIAPRRIARLRVNKTYKSNGFLDQDQVAPRANAAPFCHPGQIFFARSATANDPGLRREPAGSEAGDVDA
jgi:hypothetical protein